MAEKEYIPREAALESVREKVLICESLPDTIAKDASLFTLASMNDSLNSIPAADVRPVVLCRDCKYGQGAKMDFWNEYEGIECIGGVVHRKDWFCADGEKREES